MDIETLGAIAFLIFALGFFIYMLHFVRDDNNTTYDRRLAEAREFGYPDHDRKSRPKTLDR